MFDDNNSREIEAALREEEELDIPDGMTPEEWHRIQEEAQAEEEFIADREDTVKPLVFGKSGGADSNDNVSEAHLDDAPNGVMLGSGDLEVDRIGEPISNEEELRRESVDEDKNPVTDPVADASAADSSFGGEETVAEPSTSDPIDVAETAEPAPVEEPAPVTEGPDVVQAPSADIPAVTDTPTPIPGGMPTTPVSTEAPVVAAAGEKPKKKKTGLFVGLAILLVLIIGGVVGGIAFFSWHESPEKHVSDAVDNLFAAKTLGATKAAAIEAGKIPNIKMSVSGELMPGKEMTMSGEIAVKGNDTLYLKIDGLKDIASGLMGQLGGASSASMGIDSKSIEKLVNAIVKPIDSQWIVLTADEDSKAAMSCINSSMETLSTESFHKKLKEIFDKYPFIKYKEGSKVEERDGVKYYEVEVDEELSKKFAEELEATEEYKSLDKCMSSTAGGMINFGGTKKTNAKLSSMAADDDVTTVIKLGISSWDHEIQAMEVVSTPKEGKSTTTNVSFKIVPESEVANAKTVEDISKDLEAALKEFISDYAETASLEYCKQVKDNYGAEIFNQMFKSEEDCARQVKEEFDKQMGDVDMSQLLGGLTGGAIQTSKRI